MVKPCQQYVQRDLVGRLLPLRAFDQRDHSIEESLSRVRRDPHLDPIRQDLGSAGDRRTVAAGLADNGRALACDGRLVDRSHPFDDVAVAGYEFSRADEDHIALAQLGRANALGLRGVNARARISDYAMGNRLGLGLAQRVGLSLAPPFGHGLGKVRENHREPKPERHLHGKEQVPVLPEAMSRKMSRVVRRLPISTTNITGLPAT